jgi:Short C-terminal domain
MPGLIRGVARTAVIAGTATAVSGRVQRRQAEKYTSRDAQIAADRNAAYQQDMGYGQPAPQQYAQPAPQQYAPAPAPAPAAPSEADVISQLKQLGELHASGVLTDDEFAAQKAKLLA